MSCSISVLKIIIASTGRRSDETTLEMMAIAPSLFELWNN
jgi:hypothetical protein